MGREPNSKDWDVGPPRDMQLDRAGAGLSIGSKQTYTALESMGGAFLPLVDVLQWFFDTKGQGRHGCEVSRTIYHAFLEESHLD